MTKTNNRAIQISVYALICAAIISCKDSMPTGDGPIIPMKEYTLDNAREWTDIAKFHSPTAKRSSNNGKAAVIVEVPLAKADEGHYIEKIGIMDMAGKELAAQSMKRERNPLTYAYFDAGLIPWSGRVKVFAKCNKHDLWVKEYPVRDLGG